MDQQVFLIIDGDEQHIGCVAEVLHPECGEQDNAAAAFMHAIRYAVEEAVLGARQVNTIPLAIELR